MKYAAAHPERVAHYIGVAQVVKPVTAQWQEQAFVRHHAQATGDARALVDLQAIGTPPLGVRDALKQGELCERAGGVFAGAMRTHDLLWAALQEEETTPLDLALFGWGNRLSLDALWSDLTALDLMNEIQRLVVPVTLMLGRRDRHTSPELAQQWFSQLQAPAKRLVWFELSGHNPPFEQPQAFVSEVERSAGE